METLAPSAFLRAQGVHLAYGKRTVCGPLDFTFPRGKLVALIGPNGAGKSTLLKAILGEGTLTGGNLWRWNQRVCRNELPEQVAFVPQEPVFAPQMSVRDVLALAWLPRLGLFGGLSPQDQGTLEKALSDFDLTAYAGRPLGKLSSGERQRVFLARAFLQQPRLLLLDEPTNHLDPGAVTSFWNALLKERCERGVEAVLSTHDLPFVRAHCDWVCALRNGKVLFSEPTQVALQRDWLQEVFGH